MKKNIKTINQWLLPILIVTIGIFLSPLTSHAEGEENSDVAGATGFTYSITFPDNQIQKDLGYFKLQMNPGQNQQISIALSNPGTEKVTIDVKLNGAKTNQNGVIEYGESTIENDPSLQFDFTDVVTGPESVELAPGETKNLDLTIQMPETGFDGVLAGGIQLMRADQNGTTSNEGGSKIINQYAYVVGVVLQESENPLTPDLELNSVKAGQSNYRNAIFVNFSNVIAAYLDDMTVEVQITAKGKDTVLYDRKQTAMRMAPNSFIDFPVSMNGERMVAGDYVANILVTSGDKKWAWTEDFKISDEDANKFNERDVGLVQEKGLDWKLILLIVAGVLAIIIIIFIIIMILRKNKQKKELALKKERRKKKKTGSSNGKSSK
ncbi:DUF916 and DUF3324 domain-containing protein [Enterococcus sp. 5H]|uniref:DUF916 and DUF3324 domain-containing protein n=1 Tax=Enterococcus sp. 5H TaxID=1229490 RepID=UPI0023027225|nr:DUF916 and DUF3324 domain-containing protein [Enterococcus sp. 5H]MDA9471590.1 putative cell wall surface anchor family protein [Enterococcus sp. 5H]